MKVEGTTVERSQSTLRGVADSNLDLFNRTRLAVARKRRQYTKTELARKLDVTPKAVMDYESGKYPPAPDVFAKIQQVLDFPAEFFLGDDLDEPEEFAVSFRSLKKMTAKQRDNALSQGALAILLARWMDKKFELPPCDIPDLSAESDPEAAAEALREKWALGQLPIRNMIHLLESKGVRVFSIAVDAKAVDAFSTWKGNVPFVFLNSYKSTEHSRFDAAHELGHLVMHKHGEPLGRQAEAEANKFASAFLMPEGSVLANAPKFPTINELIRLKKVWTTSVAAVNQRLREVGVLSEWHHHNLCVQISTRGYRTHEPEGAPRETSLLLPKLFSTLYQEDGLTRGRIADELNIPLSELENMLFSLVMTGMNGGQSSPKKAGNPNLIRVK